jgi:hypothetical protein
MLPATTQRVAEHTSDCVNEMIHDRLERSIEHHRGLPAEQIERRLRELDEEWDIERAIEANASTLALIGLGLGATVNKKFFILPGVITAFLLQHALQGWCPPIPVVRRLGFRTQSEIEQERYALKALRGDFAEISELSPVPEILSAIE